MNSIRNENMPDDLPTQGSITPSHPFAQTASMANFHRRFKM